MTPNPTWHVSAVYHFKKLDHLDQLQALLESTAAHLGVIGLFILGSEGINTTCAAPSSEALEAWKSFLREQFSNEMMFKDSACTIRPFRMFKVKQREEIVTAGIPGVSPQPGINHHLTPSEWNEVMKNDPNVVVIDTRNWYEYKIGSFDNAVNPNIEKFTEFPQWLEGQGYKKDQKMLIFCTGGIRCEKGILELQDKGYDNVYQLEGGILNYLKEFPDDKYWGECFVFDQRVAVDQKLQASATYKLCPHCGNPAKDVVACVRCDHETVICEDCQKIQIKAVTCSKNCAHWWGIFPGKKGAHQHVSY